MGRRRKSKGPAWCHRPKGSQHWHYDFRLGGHRYRGSTETDQDDAAELVVASIRRKIILGEDDENSPAPITIDEAFGRYLLEHAQHKTDYYDAARDAKDIAAAFGKTTFLHDITDDMLAKVVAKWRGEKDRRYRKKKDEPFNPPLVSPRTVNARIVRLRSVINMAGKKWKRQVPVIEWPLHKVKEPEPNIRYLTPDEVDRILAEAADHLKPGIIFSLYTGVRLDNCISLDWRQVNMRRREATFRQKGDRTLVVPLIEPVFVMLANIGPKDSGPVFLWRPSPKLEPRPLKSWRKAWKNALRRAGVEDTRWHNIRHTAASWMIWNGVDLKTIGSVLGHASIATTMRYAHLKTDSRRSALEAIWSGAAPVADVREA